MDRRPLVVGNWKMYKTIDEARQFVAALLGSMGEEQDVDVWLAAPYTLIAPCHESAGSRLHIGAQNMNDASEGAFTGEIAASMLLDAGADFVVLGHSERRQLFNESNALIAKKVKRALKEGIKPLLCIGETLSEREGGQTEAALQKQLEETLAGLPADNLCHQLTVAYEPVWAIGTGKVATSDGANSAHQFCRQWLQSHFGEASEAVRILYGGSVNATNCQGLFQMAHIDGALVGGASLNLETFNQIIQAAKKSRQKV